MPARLKALELQGYKTFANRTLFEFGDSITAIVGPNGSGKSNIADSIRWVLGEQSFSLLRGKKTEDMIFSGSEQRSRASMASAMITFDNQDNWLPIDFSEVAITRRAYRDGTNEYLINGQRVRLKDVSELLAQSGLSERTYTIIGQGLVDAALALKAEDRRKLFEEAAGIGIYRTRREEALRRLDTTKRNLERIEDILAELEPRLRSLERQARRTQEFEQIKADLRILLRDWYGYHWHREQKELSDVREAVHVQEVELNKARAAHTKVEERLAILRKQSQSIRVDLNEWHRQSASFHARREVSSRELAVAEERLRSIDQQMLVAQNELANLVEETALHQQKLSQSEEEIGRVTRELEESEVKLQEVSQALEKRQGERNQVDRQIQNLRQQSNNLNSKNGQLQARITERLAQIEKSRKALQLSEQAIQAAEKECSEMTSLYLQSLAAQEQAGQALSQLAEAAKNHRDQNRDLEDALRKNSQELSGISAERARVKAVLGVLEQAEAEFVGYGNGARLLLSAARSGKIDKVGGALNQLINVPAEFELAISASLGEFLDSIVLQDSPDQALELLMTGSQRGALIPLEAISAETILRDEINLKTSEVFKTSEVWLDEIILRRYKTPLSEDRADDLLQELKSVGAIGIAAEFVQSAPDLKPAIELLLGKVWLAPDRAVAQAIIKWAREKTLPLDSAARVVTLDGEVYYLSGPVIAGHSSGASEQTLLGRGRQRSELVDRAGVIDGQVNALQMVINDLENRLQDFRKEDLRLSAQTKAGQELVDRCQLASTKAQYDLEQASRQLHWNQEQHKRNQSELAQAEKDLSIIKHDLAELDTRIGAVRESLRQQHNLLSTLSLDDHQAQVSHWKTLTAVNSRALADERRRYEERAAQVEASNRHQQYLSRRIDDLKNNKKSLESEIVVRRADESEINRKIQELDALINPAEGELDRLEKDQEEVLKVEAAARQSVSFADHRHSQMRITLVKQQESVQNLQRRIEEDFGLVAFEYAEQISGQTTLPLEGMVEQLPRVAELSPEIDEAIKRHRAQLRRMGPINPEAQAEYIEVQNRYQHMTEQVADLRKAEADVRQVIQELDDMMQREFHKTFDAVAIEFKGIFSRLFGGGSARLVLTDPDNLSDTGIDIEARLPGRRMQGLSLLSGGERSLTATSLVFALLRVSPTPFCVLDEVDAMLDEANVGRFRDLLGELSQHTQFIIVTHNRHTVQAAEVIYGVTMGRDSVSQVLSLKMDEVSTIFTE